MTLPIDRELTASEKALLAHMFIEGTAQRTGAPVDVVEGVWDDFIDAGRVHYRFDPLVAELLVDGSPKVRLTREFLAGEVLAHGADGGHVTRLTVEDAPD